MSSPQQPEQDAAGGPDGILDRLRPSWPSRQPVRFRPSGDLLRIVGVWAVWLAIICSFQAVVPARLQPSRPDNVLAWTQYETSDAVLTCRPMLSDPNMNEHVAFDSEYYLSIAQNGYDDPNASAAGGAGWRGVPSCSASVPGERTSLNYAFLPGYPMAMKGVILVLEHVPFAADLTDTGRATLAGIIVSALGGLLAMLGLARLMAFYDRRRKKKNGDDDTAGSWGGAGGLRAALYLLVFPTGFYLAQVYTEGLFIGLAFMACAMAVERKFVAGAVLAALATLVRPAGVFLFFPLAWAAFEIGREYLAARRASDTAGADSVPSANPLSFAGPALLSLAPVAAFGAWYMSALGEKWRFVEDSFFTRKFDLAASVQGMTDAWNSLITGVDKTGTVYYRYFTGPQGSDQLTPLQPASSFYLALEFIGLALAILGTIWLIRKMPGVALFGLGVLVLSFGSMGGAPQGMIRYVIAVPGIFLMLGWFGRFRVFDRSWVMASTLVMGLLVTLYSFGFWVA